MAADKPCPQLQPSLSKIGNLRLKVFIFFDAKITINNLGVGYLQMYTKVLQDLGQNWKS